MDIEQLFEAYEVEEFAKVCRIVKSESIGSSGNQQIAAALLIMAAAIRELVEAVTRKTNE